jgi:mannose-6-phosphate isomerase
MIERLDCAVMPYAWGSRTVIAELQGRAAPSDGPEAELWMGAHPVAPSRVIRCADRSAAAGARSLADMVEGAPETVLGPEVARAFGGKLPFLLKVLAADEPLSLQAHPTAAQARAGFDDEERRGVPRSAPDRNYKDPSHKPELLCALTPFDALCGFRRVTDTLALFDALAVPALAPALAPLRASPDARGLAGTFAALMQAEPAARARMVSATLDGARAEVARDGRWRDECGWALRLAELYPGDVGVVSALLLELVHLAPGEAIYIGAGSLHAYLRGAGVEIMASSDNVLRGGLTKKHVDVPELLRVLDFEDGRAGALAKVQRRAVDAYEQVWDTPAAEFRLSVVRVGGDGDVTRIPRGPELLLVTEGSVRVRDERGALTLARGEVAFVSAETRALHLSGEGLAYRAVVNLS